MDGHNDFEDATSSRDVPADHASGDDEAGDHAPEHAVAGVATPLSERGRDLTLLALALIIINEAIFTGYVIAEDQQAIVAQAGRFALKAGMAWLTWQGFMLSRWILVVLVVAAILAAPFALADAYSGGVTAFALVLTATVAAYVVSGWLLIASADVAQFIRHRRDLRNRDLYRG